MVKIHKYFSSTLVVICLVGVTFLYAIFTTIQGNVQDQTFRRDNETFLSLPQDLQKQDYTSVEAEATSLLQTHPDNYLLEWFCAVSLYDRKLYADAVSHFEAARINRPFLVTNPQFVAQYGESLYYQGNLREGLKYLEQAQRLDPNQTGKEVDPLINDIKKKLNIQ